MKPKKLEKLAMMRKKYGYTYEQMASKLNISKSYYWQIENNYRHLYYDMAKKIANIFGKKPDDIFFD